MIAELRVLASAWLGWLADAVNPATEIRPPWPEDQPLGEYPDLLPGCRTPMTEKAPAGASGGGLAHHNNKEEVQ